MPKCIKVVRQVWHFKGAALLNLRCELKACNWDRLSFGSVDEAANYFIEMLTRMCRQYIPCNAIEEKKQVHPWLDDACYAAIDRKNAAEGSRSFQEEQRRCSATLSQAYAQYREKLKMKIKSLSKSDKRWWQLNRELLQKKARVSAIPPLRTVDGQWHLDSLDKANVFAKCFSAKCALPPMPEDSFIGRPEVLLQEFLAL